MGAALALIDMAEILIGEGNGAVVGGFAFAWLAASGIVAPLADTAKVATIRHRRGHASAGLRSFGAVIALDDEENGMAALTCRHRKAAVDRGGLLRQLFLSRFGDVTCCPLC